MKPRANASGYLYLEVLKGAFSDVELTDFDGLLLCPDCLESLTVCCQDCGARMWRDDNEGSDEHPLCESCRRIL